MTTKKFIYIYGGKELFVSLFSRAATFNLLKYKLYKFANNYEINAATRTNAERKG